MKMYECFYSFYSFSSHQHTLDTGFSHTDTFTDTSTDITIHVHVVSSHVLCTLVLVLE